MAAPSATGPGSAELPSLSLERAPLPMAAVEGTTHVVRYANPAFCQLIGVTLAQLVGQPLADLLPTRDRCKPLLDRVLRTGIPVHHTEREPGERPSVFWSYTMWPLQTEQPFVGVMIQVTESTKAHETLVEMNEALLLGSIRQHELVEEADRLNERLLEEIAERQKTAQRLAEKARLLDLTQDAILVSDTAGRITYWNHGAEQLYGWSAQEALGRTKEELLQPERLLPAEEVAGALSRTNRWTGELVHRKRNGERVHVLVRKTLDRDSEGKPGSLLQTITDITERKQAEQALQVAEAQLADRALHLEKMVAARTVELTRSRKELQTESEERKRLEAEIAGAIEGEQERLGQELHDGVLQELTGITLLLHALSKSLLETAPVQSGVASRLSLMLEQTHGTLRDLAKCLYPVELEQHGLLAALTEFARRTELHQGITCSVQTGTEDLAGVKDAASVQLYRIAQEAVQNAVKHAHATGIFIRLDKQDGQWQLHVQDNGVGLRGDPATATGMGLRIMQYRARLIAGTLSVGGGEGGGVLVQCVAPAADRPPSSPSPEIRDLFAGMAFERRKPGP